MREVGDKERDPFFLATLYLLSSLAAPLQTNIPNNQAAIAKPLLWSRQMSPLTWQTCLVQANVIAHFVSKMQSYFSQPIGWGDFRLPQAASSLRFEYAWHGKDSWRSRHPFLRCESLVDNGTALERVPELTPKEDIFDNVFCMDVLHIPVQWSQATTPSRYY